MEYNHKNKTKGDYIKQGWGKLKIYLPKGSLKQINALLNKVLLWCRIRGVLYNCYSVIGSPDEIDYDKAAVFWSSFYYMMYEINKINMPQKDLWPIIENVTKSFKIKLNYFSIIGSGSPKSIDHLREFNYDSGEKIFDKVKETGFRNQFI